MKNNTPLRISEVVIRRLPVYLRYLTRLQIMKVDTVSSQQMGKALDYNPAQIRKDLAYFGEFGRKGKGYDVNYLVKKIRQILHLDQPIHVALVGAGKLGQALSNYNSQLKENMNIVAIFDRSREKVGNAVGDLHVQHIDDFTQIVKEKSIRIGIITVPDHSAQEVADLMVSSGIEAILNFAPIILKTPDHVRVHHADVTTELYSLAFYLTHQNQ